MKDAGYDYVNIDHCWHGKRGDTGKNLDLAIASHSVAMPPLKAK